MKSRSIFFLSFLLLVMNGMAFSQTKVEVTEGSVNISPGSQNGFTVTLYSEDLKAVEDEWKSTMKKYKAKPEGKIKKELFSDDAEIKAMSNNTVDVYAVASPSGDKIKFSACFDLGGAFLNSKEHAEGAAVAREIMQEFAMKFAKGLVEEELKEQEKVVKNLEKDLDKLKKDKEKSEKDIVDCEESIKKSKSDIVQNEKDQVDKEKEIEKAKKEVEDIQKRLDEFK